MRMAPNSACRRCGQPTQGQAAGTTADQQQPTVAQSPPRNLLGNHPIPYHSHVKIRPQVPCMGPTQEHALHGRDKATTTNRGRVKRLGVVGRSASDKAS